MTRHICAKRLNNYPVEDNDLATTHSLNTSTDLENINNLQALVNENQY